MLLRDLRTKTARRLGHTAARVAILTGAMSTRSIEAQTNGRQRGACLSVRDIPGPMGQSTSLPGGSNVDC